MTRPGNSPSFASTGAASDPPSRIRTLFLTLDASWPAVSGADLRNWQNAEAASGLGPVAVTSVTASTEAPPAPIAAYSLTNRPVGSVWRQWPTAAVADLRIPGDARAGLAKALEAFAPDVIVVEHPALVPVAAAARPAGTRLVADLHNIESAAEARMAAALSRFSRRRWRAAWAARASARAERKIAALADAVWVCSSEEAARFRPMAGATPIYVVPNGMPRSRPAPAGLPPLPAKPLDTAVLVFVGHLAYPPNVDAAVWLAERILPRLRERVDARLILAGRSPAPAVRALDELPAVRVVANPDDTGPILDDADIAVLPIRLGGGTRIKVAEAMSHGLPVVATAFAVEGVGLTDRLHFRRAETTQDFVDAIAALAADAAERERLRAAAWAHCLEHLGPEAIARAVRTGLAAP